MILGEIYAFINNDTHEVYIGSTVEGIKKRYNKHLTDLRMYLGITKKGCRNFRSSFDILYCNNYKVIRIDKKNFKDKKELNLFESFYILKFKKEGIKIVNKIIPNREARKFDYRNFGLKDINFHCPSLFPPECHLISH